MMMFGLGRLGTMRLGMVLGVLALGGAACGDGDSEEATPAPGATERPTATATATSQPDPTATRTVPAPLQVPSLVQLVDVESGEVKTLFESRELRTIRSLFVGDRIVVQAVLDEVETYVYDSTGYELDEEPSALGSFYQCLDVAGVERCGSTSPGGVWMLNQRDSRPVTVPPGYTTDATDTWLINLETDAELKVLEGYLHCGGCDGRYGPRWSPNGQFVVFAETGGDQRRFLTELASGDTGQVGLGAGITLAPDWSADGQLLLYPEEFEGETILMNAVTGTRVAIDLEWPVAFDATGSVMYSPAWSQRDPNDDNQSFTTTAVDVESREELFAMDGVPPSMFLFTGEIALVETEIGVVAALLHADGCEGTAIYVDGEMEQCVEGGVNASVGATGLVAVARFVGERSEYAEGPGGDRVFAAEYEVVVIDPVSGREVYATESILTPRPVRRPVDAGLFLEWDETGSRLLVRNFYSVGL